MASITSLSHGCNFATAPYQYNEKTRRAAAASQLGINNHFDRVAMAPQFASQRSSFMGNAASLPCLPKRRRSLATRTQQPTAMVVPPEIPAGLVAGTFAGTAMASMTVLTCVAASVCKSAFGVDLFDIPNTWYPHIIPPVTITEGAMAGAALGAFAAVVRTIAGLPPPPV